jgi:hypothetical protein
MGIVTFGSNETFDASEILSRAARIMLPSPRLARIKSHPAIV